MLLVAVHPASAQQPARADGRVILLTESDSAVVPHSRVVLHRVSRSLQGPIDSALTDARGWFHFRFLRDTSAIYLLSSRYAGIEYFSAVLRGDVAQPDTGLVLLLSDTASAAPVAVSARHLVISRPASDGSRPVLEIVTLSNRGARTRVPPDSLTPSWAARLPSGAANFRAGQGDASPEAVVYRSDSVLLFAPIAPGEKQLVYTYALPQTRHPVALPVTDSIEGLHLLLEEPNARVRSPGIVRADSETIENRTFWRWSGPVSGGSVVTLDLPTGGSGPLLPVLVGFVALALALGAWKLRSGSRLAPGPAAVAEGLVEALARLDARYVGREGAVPPEEWASYQAERARLKSALASHLASAGRVP